MFADIFKLILQDFNILTNEIKQNIQNSESKTKLVDDNDNKLVIKLQKKKIKKLKKQISNIKYDLKQDRLNLEHIMIICNELLEFKKQLNIEHILKIGNDLLIMKQQLDNYNLTFFGIQ